MSPEPGRVAVLEAKVERLVVATERKVESIRRLGEIIDRAGR